MYKSLKKLKSNKQYLTKQQFKTIKGQMLAGDIQGGLRGMNRILARLENETNMQRKEG